MTDEKFSFKIFTEDTVRKNIMNLNGSKSTLNGNIVCNRSLKDSSIIK